MKNTILSHIKTQFSELKTTIPLAEYIFWWILRFAMIGGMIYLTVTNPGTYHIKLMFLNSLGMYAIPLLRLLDFKKLLFAKIPFRTQTYISVMIFFGSFMGHAVNAYRFFTSYDKFLHVVSGVIVVLIGDLLAHSYDKNMTVKIRFFLSQGLSYTIMVLWELCEFFSDFYIKDSVNQGFSYAPAENFFFFKIFGHGQGNVAQYPVFDTNIDMLCAVVSSLITGIIIACIIKYKEKRKRKPEENTAEQEKDLSITN